jgi:phosphoribosyl-ATP pyrophosphohydrolase
MSRIGEIMDELYAVIEDRKINPREGAYTTYLLEKGVDKICKKIGEESTEVVIAAKNNDRSEIIYEIGDLFYHTMVLMVDRGVSLEDIYLELKSRRS